MTFDDVKNNIDNQEYKHTDTFRLTRSLLRHDHIFDENESVKWNREEVQRRNDETRKTIKQIHEENSKITENFKTHLFQAATREYNLNNNQFEMIYNKLMSELDCNYICTDFVDEFEDFCDFIYQCWNA